MSVVAIVVSTAGVLAGSAYLGRHARVRRHRRCVHLLSGLVGQRREFGWEIGVWRFGAVAIARATVGSVDAERGLVRFDEIDAGEHPFARQVGTSETVPVSRLRFIADPLTGARQRL